MMRVKVDGKEIEVTRSAGVRLIHEHGAEQVDAPGHGEKVVADPPVGARDDLVVGVDRDVPPVTRENSGPVVDTEAAVESEDSVEVAADTKRPARKSKAD